MKHYHLIKNVMGGSEIFDDNGNQVGYSLPSVIGEGEDFFAMDGTPVGQSFGTEGGEFFAGPDGAGFLDGEFLMGQNAFLDGDPFRTGEDGD